MIIDVFRSEYHLLAYCASQSLISVGLSQLPAPFQHIPDSSRSCEDRSVGGGVRDMSVKAIVEGSAGRYWRSTELQKAIGIGSTAKVPGAARMGGPSCLPLSWWLNLL
jgi:hypothetical protein